MCYYFNNELFELAISLKFYVPTQLYGNVSHMSCTDTHTHIHTRTHTHIHTWTHTHTYTLTHTTHTRDETIWVNAISCLSLLQNITVLYCSNKCCNISIYCNVVSSLVNTMRTTYYTNNLQLLQLIISAVCAHTFNDDVISCIVQDVSYAI